MFHVMTESFIIVVPKILARKAPGKRQRRVQGVGVLVFWLGKVRLFDEEQFGVLFDAGDQI